jgi:nitrate/nitrite transport system substrate-binding protein
MGSTDIGCDLGVKKYKDDYMLFYNNGATNTPKLSYGIWFMAQYMRFGMISSAPSYKAVAQKLIMSDLYAEVAKSMGVTVQEDMKPFKTNLETITFDPNNPAAYISAAKK